MAERVKGQPKCSAPRACMYMSSKETTHVTFEEILTDCLCVFVYTCYQATGSPLMTHHGRGKAWAWRPVWTLCRRPGRSTPGVGYGPCAPLKGKAGETKIFLKPWSHNKPCDSDFVSRSSTSHVPNLINNAEDDVRVKGECLLKRVAVTWLAIISLSVAVFWKKKQSCILHAIPSGTRLMGTAGFHFLSFS